VRTFWYVSHDKLRALGAFDPSWLSRVHPNAKVGLGPASVGVDIDGVKSRTLRKAVARADRELQGQTGEVSHFISDSPPAVYFDICGPACRMVIDDTFWVAAVVGDVAVLLVGSASNAVGASAIAAMRRPGSASMDPIGALLLLALEKLPIRDRLAGAVSGGEIFSSSLDPVGAARHLLDRLSTGAAEPGADKADTEHAENQHRAVTEHQVPADAFAYAWSALMQRGGLDVGGNEISALPRAHSVSLYVTRHRIEDSDDARRYDVKWLVLGTPLYVEQVP
jgi:hypothetical protein